MRSLSARRGMHQEEEESVFVSMTDMTVSFLFIIMILLAFFASRFNDEETVPLNLYEPLVEERDTLRQSLDQTSEQLSTALSDIADLTMERDTLLRLIEDLRHRLAMSEERLAAREKELETALTERDALQKTLTDTQIELDAALARVEALREALIRTREERDATVEMLSDRQDQIRELEAEIAALAAEIARLRRPDPLKTYLAQVAAQREQVLARLRDDLLADFPELEGVITSESDVLRFQGEGLFASGSDVLLRNRIPLVERIAERLDALLPCYTLGPRADYNQKCNPAFAVIEAVQIEGHTDSDGADAPNIALSARRGAATYSAMTTHRSALVEHLNLDDQPVLSVAGYGEGRPVTNNDTTQGKSTNRRIDLRFIMVTPGESAAISQIRGRLRGEEAPL